jgi:hypothetical protein
MVVTTLRSGNTIDNNVVIDETIPTSPTEATTSKVREREKVNAPPFPQKLVKPKKEKQLLDIFETSRKVKVNIPLLDAIQKIPSYVKFLKDCCTHKRKFQAHEKVALTKEVSVVLLTSITLQLVDRSIKIPRGILEDVLVKVDKFIILVDFIVLDMEESSIPLPLPIILGRPFMRITDTKICVKRVL